MVILIVMIKVVTLVCARNCMAKSVILHAMVAFDSIASYMFGLMGRLTSFQKSPLGPPLCILHVHLI